MATIAAIFERYEDADRVLHALNEIGLGRDDLSVVAPEEKIQDKLSGEEDVAADTAKTGALFGGLAGLLVGVGVVLVPGVGPLLTVGALATALGSTAVGAGIGAAAGSFRGALEDMGIPDVEATVLEESVKEGGILVTAIAEGDQVQEVKNIMRRYNALDLETRKSMWERDQQEHYKEVTDAQKEQRRRGKE